MQRCMGGEQQPYKLCIATVALDNQKQQLKVQTNDLDTHIHDFNKIKITVWDVKVYNFEIEILDLDI